MSSTDIVYIHSPITYSIARQLIDDGVLVDPVVVCGRALEWDGPHVSVHDDGIWSIERVRDFLAELARTIPPQAEQFDIYLPHTAYLLGKIFKLSPAVRSIAYLEEGNTSCNPEFAQDRQNLQVQEKIFLQLMSREPQAMQRFGLNASHFNQINRMPAIWFDDDCPKYAGAYRISDDAFPTLDKVTTVKLPRLDKLADGQRSWLCFLPNIVNMVSKHGPDSLATQKLLHSLVVLLRSVSAMVAHEGGQLMIKFHPVDEANLGPEFKEELYRFGQGYPEFAAEHGIDVQLEPAMFNFGHFIVVNESAATRYCALLHGAEAVVNLSID